MHNVRLPVLVLPLVTSVELWILTTLPVISQSVAFTSPALPPRTTVLLSLALFSVTPDALTMTISVPLGVAVPDSVM